MAQKRLMDDNDWDNWIDKVFAAEPIPDEEVSDEAWTVTPCGPPLTDEEINIALDRLTGWQSPNSFRDDVLQLCSRCSPSDYFSQPRLKFLHDAFVLAKFATKRSVDQIRLASRDERWPDGHVKIGSRTFNVEVTSTHGDRKLGQEYRKVKDADPVIEEDPIEDWIARADSIPEYLEKAIRDKIDMNYSSPCWLVVYLNISEWGIRQNQIEQMIAATVSCYGEKFENISVLWKGKLYSDH
jgi:hypothetical protein